MYLTGDAKLWWRTKYMEIGQGRCAIDTWDDLKREMKSQFFPENVDYLARRRLYALEHTGTVHEYVKTFASIMLDITDMSEKDKVFAFLEGLKPWARLELQRQGVRDLAAAQAAAERLTDYVEDPLKPKSTVPSTVGGQKNGEGQSSQVKGGRSDKRPVGLSPSKGKGAATGGRPLECWSCGGPHKASVCPNKYKLSAVQARSSAGATDAAEKSEDERETCRVGAIRFL